MTRSTTSFIKIGIGFAAWWVICVTVQTYLLLQIGYTYNVALVDSMVTQLLLGITSQAFSSSLRYYEPSQKNAAYALSGSIALAALCTFGQQSLIQQFISDNETYYVFLQSSLLIRGFFNWLILLLIGVLTWSWVFASERMNIEKQNEDAVKLARDAELSNLRMQLQPHFLFNSLNSISALVSTQPSQAREMIQQLSDFLRGTIKREERQVINLKEEIQHLQLYLEIEKVRFGHRLTTEIDYDDITATLSLPPLVLQPIVENAIKFGLYDTIGAITISITARSEGNVLWMEVKNPFDPNSAQPPQGTGFGLNSIRRRLYLLYFQNDLLKTRQENNTFITTLKIPQSK